MGEVNFGTETPPVDKRHGHQGATPTPHQHRRGAALTTIINQKRLREDVAGYGIRAHLHVLDRIASTNTFALALRQLPALVVADKQTAGKGRRGNTWHSRPGDVIFSWASVFSHTPPPTLSLIAGYSLAAALRGMGDGRIMLKWPNDLVFIDDGWHKVGGVLIESRPISRKRVLWVVGVGINFLTQPAVKIKETPLENAIAKLVWRLQQTLDEIPFDIRKLGPFDALHNCQIRFISNNKALQGYARGMDSCGRLIVESEGITCFYDDIHSIECLR